MQFRVTNLQVLNECKYIFACIISGALLAIGVTILQGYLPERSPEVAQFMDNSRTQELDGIEIEYYIADKEAERRTLENGLRDAKHHDLIAFSENIIGGKNAN